MYQDHNIHNKLKSFALSRFIRMHFHFIVVTRLSWHDEIELTIVLQCSDSIDWVVRLSVSNLGPRVS